MLYKKLFLIAPMNVNLEKYKIMLTGNETILLFSLQDHDKEYKEDKKTNTFKTANANKIYLKP